MDAFVAYLQDPNTLNSWSFFFVANIVISLMRFCLMKLMVAVGRSKFADQTRITSRPPITEKQIERESVWQYGYVPDILAAMLVFYFGCFTNMPWFDWRAIFVQFIIHITIVEFIYYWAHRILHVGWFYKRYHQYHHASINTEPTTSVSFEMGERVVYTILFSITPILSYYLGYQSYITYAYQLLWFDFQNGCGHINFEFFPKWLSDTPLWYFWYTASYHSIHHTKFKKNYSLFMPWPDVLFGTADMKLTRDVFVKALEGTPYVPSQQTVNENLDEKNLQIV